jgi:hypothetical protein
MDSLLHIASLIFRIEISEIKSSMQILPQTLKERDMLLIEKDMLVHSITPSFCIFPFDNMSKFKVEKSMTDVVN